MRYLVGFMCVLALGVMPLVGCSEGGGEGGSGGSAGTGGTGERFDSAVQIPLEIDGSSQNPAWSPDGDQLVFTSFKEGYNEEPADLLIIEDIEHGVVRLLVSDGSGNINLPGSSWNETREAITFASTREPHDEIFVIDDGGKPGDEERITLRDDYVAYEPSFSPDGNWLVFESHELDVETNGIIMKYEIDGDDEYVALTGLDDDCRQPNWAPAGDKILYQRFDGDQWELWVMNDDGTGAEQITSGAGDKTDGSFSPDGDWIVYSSDEGDLEFASIFVIPTTGGESMRVTNQDGYDGAPSWSPVGSRIAFESYPGDPDGSDGTTLWVIDVPEDLQN